ncbi:MFS general substrate transporter [Hypoxylon fragiforme]|uniref:MFS general substrate transporter n=1 Tax=Hypoxylon fragiforme TaxID=63214 RepID=UPI0020C714B3|nr:MFS general substrate transporter [Hypoxylon fragiforme]KAI2604502.1 MFS general substrate transporter [Hypoxylon fragiforme]
MLVQAPIWGYSLAFGIFQEYYTSNAAGIASLRGPHDAAAIAPIGTSQTGVLYLMMPVAFTLLTRFPRLRQWFGPLGLVLTSGCLLASSFATTAAQLVAVQGVLHAVGCGLLFSSTSLCLDEWFAERKGLAYGAMWSGKSGFGAGMPFMTSALLNRYGARTTLRIFSVGSAVLTIPPLLLMRPRPAADDTTTATSTSEGENAVESSNNRSRGRVSFSFIYHPTFWVLQFGNILQSLGYLMPSTYLASYATLLGFPSITGPIFLALISLASVPGSLLIGLLNDQPKFKPTTVILISSLGSALPVFLLWGLGGGNGNSSNSSGGSSDSGSTSTSHLAILVLFTLLYGFFAGGFSSTWSGILHELKRTSTTTSSSSTDPHIDTGLIFGMLLGGRGLGFVLSGLVGPALLKASPSNPNNPLRVTGAAADFSGYATQYGPMIIYTGFTALLGGWAWFWSAGKRVMRVL